MSQGRQRDYSAAPAIFESSKWREKMQSPENRDVPPENHTPFTCPWSVTIRRNPHRKARPTPAPGTVTHHPSPDNSDTTTTTTIPSFPTAELLAMELPEKNNSEPVDSSSGGAANNKVSEKLKVFLRIRPLKVKSGTEKGIEDDSRAKLKNVWPRRRIKERDLEKGKKMEMKKSESCIVVNDSSSVTLSPPLSLQESRRVKTEVYEGFSNVFSTDSSQVEVYERMMKPLVEEFIGGKSGMLVALGPSGSGKTHTVFGSPREPGMIPLALRQIFRRNEERESKPLRSYYITMFEISSERKGERIMDLLSDGGDTVMYQTTIKGLQEIVISDVAQAESLIACAMLKRSTAMTKANSQSSRSQCIINICCDPLMVEGQHDAKSYRTVLTVIDLAGAEREKSTELQGKRLGESSFINNTSMVFGLCLRSLFEHQKNPKKPLQKHFQSSMLTKYLRDYLEGKKRMSLILTVKSEEKDYADTSFLLRQASPFMQIKFTGATQPDSLGAKRKLQAVPRSDMSKRIKVNNCNGHKEDIRVQSIDAKETDIDETIPADCKEEERSSQIMINFARAMWKVLKEYKNKLQTAEKEIQDLRGSLDLHKTRNLELEKELQDLKTNLHCSKDTSMIGGLVEVDPELKYERSQEEKINSNSQETCSSDNLVCVSSYCIDSARNFGSPGGQSVGISLQKNSNASFSFAVSGCAGGSRIVDTLQEIEDDSGGYFSCLRGCTRDDDDLVIMSPLSLELHSENDQESNTLVRQIIESSCESIPNGRDIEQSSSTEYLEATASSSSTVETGVGNPPRHGNDLLHVEDDKKKDYQNIEDDQQLDETSVVPDECCNLVKSSHENLKQRTESSCDTTSNTKYFNRSTSSECPELSVSSLSIVGTGNDHCSPHSTAVIHMKQDKKLFSDKRQTMMQDKPSIQGSIDNDRPKNGTKASQQGVNDLKPKRRLNPASTQLLRDMRIFDLEDDIDTRQKGGRGRKNTVSEQNQRTEGSNNLFRLLTSNC